MHKKIEESANEFIERRPELVFVADESIVRDVVMKCFQTCEKVSLDLVLAELREESIKCNEPDPVRTGFDWAAWLEQRLK